jgi:hypothetical protein
VIEAAGEHVSDYEFQLAAGTFHEDIDDLAGATKYSYTYEVMFRRLMRMQVLLHLCQAESQGLSRHCGLRWYAASALARRCFSRALLP